MPPATAAPAQCNVTRAISFDGRDILAVGSQATPQDCCDYCSRQLYCFAWTLYQGVCYLKDSAAGNHVACPNCTSGTLGAHGGGGGGSTCTVRTGFDALPDGPAGIGSLLVASPDECCGACEQTFNCSAWTVYDGSCYLKPVFAGFQGGCAGCVSGVVVHRPPQPAPAPAPPTPPLPPRKFNMSGITFTGGRYCPNVTMGSTRSLQSLEHLASTGATWVAIVVTQYQWRLDSTRIFPLYNGSEVFDVDNGGYYEFVTLTEAEVTAAIRHAHALGLRVMLKPHVDLLRNNKPAGAFWRGDIGGCPAAWNASVQRFTPGQWDAWFASYEAFLLPYARLAQREGVAMLSVNTELYCPNIQEQHWRTLLPRVRSAYAGLLTVAQIKGHETELKWWDLVDVIGIDAYYPIAGATLAEMVYSWQQYVALAKQLSDAYGGKPVAYTEIGYCSGQCSRNHTPDAADDVAHALHYQAVLEAFRGTDAWFLGVFWWNWNTDPGVWPAGAPDDCLTPQWKPAEDILRWYWNATRPKPNRSAAGPALCMGAGRCTC